MRYVLADAPPGRFFTLLLFAFFSSASRLSAQDSLASRPVVVQQVKKTTPKWYETVQFRGYTQVRYNRLLETNPDLRCEQCDRYWGDNNGLGIRRLRLVFFGNIHPRVYMYIQQDFASNPSSSTLHYGQIRDAYFDLFLNKTKSFRLRLGQSKVPYGFENLQSSQNRTPLDRNDALNSAVPNERDMAAILYWAPTVARERFSHLVKAGLKGSGDYGVFGLGVFNGQTANRPEANDNMHLVARASYPFQLSNGQIIEPGLQAYTGRYVLSSVTKEVKGTEGFVYDDRRMAASFVLYPQPFGLAAEYNIGTGPEYNPDNNTIEQKSLYGGYVQAQYLLRLKDQVLIPFSRWQYYHGGKKAELDARSYRVKELEIGLEWQPIRNFELVAMYVISDRTFEDAVLPVNRQTGSLLRIQAQVNY